MKIRIVATLFILVLAGLDCLGQTRPQTYMKTTGDVLMYEDGWALHCITASPCVELLIMRVPGQTPRSTKSRIIKVEYIFWLGTAINISVANGEKWKFKLARKKECDGTIRELQFTELVDSKGEVVDHIPRMKNTPNAEDIGIPDDTILPCYQLKTSDIKKI